MKIAILTVGKTKEKWLHQALDEYEKRVQHRMKIRYIICKDDKELVEKGEKRGALICLDPRGTSYTSESFAQFIQDHFLYRGGGELSFVIGGCEGIPERLLAQNQKMSFSSLTFTHQMIRLLLLEQLYRATEILRHSPYHK